MMTAFRSVLLATLIALLLGNCASTPPPPPEPPAPPARDRVAELRTAATATRSAVEVAPLQNPAVDLLLSQASALEEVGRHAEAAAVTEQVQHAVAGDVPGGGGAVVALVGEEAGLLALDDVHAEPHAVLRDEQRPRRLVAFE